jgi:hypothetical protein
MDAPKADSALSAYRLKIAMVYQDEATWEWADQAVGRVARLVGRSCVQSAWWDMDQLSEPSVEFDAVQAAALADMLIVSIHAADQVPAAFHGWIVKGLARRCHREGILVALLATPGHPSASAARLRCQLEALACSSNLDFLPCEQNLRADAPDFSRRNSVATAETELLGATFVVGHAVSRRRCGIHE